MENLGKIQKSAKRPTNPEQDFWHGSYRLAMMTMRMWKLEMMLSKQAFIFSKVFGKYVTLSW